MTAIRQWGKSRIRSILTDERRRALRLPHQGAKERARAKRCFESEFLNQKFVDYWLAHPMNVILSSDQCHARSTPTLCQMSKRQYEARSREVA